MTVPSIKITNQGIIAPSTQEVKNGLWQMFLQAFGTDLNQSEDTPQGQLVVSLTAIVQDERDKMIQLMNQFDPQYSTGIWQDAIGELYFLTRQEDTFSNAPILLEGLSGQVVPTGFQIGDQSGNIWQTTGDFIIDTGGSITGTVQCLTAGAIEAAPNAITNIIVALSGLDRVTNPSAAIAGLDEESKENFEIRRQESVAANAKNTDASVRGAIANLPSVVDVWVKSNPTDATVNFGSTNYPVTRNSILISVVGGTDYDIAWQALVKAGTGCSFNGNTHVTVYDTDAYPQSPPEYSVTFLRPSNVMIYWRVKLLDLSKLTVEADLNIKAAIINAMSIGSTRARIGGVLRAAAYICKISSIDSQIDLESVEISTDNLNWKNVIEIGVDQFPVSSTSTISIVGA